MRVIPAIDLMNGKVVRLNRGDPKKAKVYVKWGPPIQTAAHWKAQGAERLHIIDLDAAFDRGNNRTVIAEIAKETCLPIQVGGGIRTEKAVEELLDLGARFVILGSLAFADFGMIQDLQGRFGSNQFIVALDNKNGRIMVEGWRRETSFTVSSALEKFVEVGIKSFLVTSIAKDGMLSGPDVEILKEACGHPGIEVIAAGGIGRLADLVVLKQIGVTSVVVGKALYEERFTLKEALAAVEAG